MRWRNSHSVVGVDVGARTINVAQLTRAGSGWRLKTAITMPRSNGTGPLDVVEWVKVYSLFERAGIRGLNVVVHAPPALLRREMLELPPRTSGAPIEQLARGELSRATKLDAAPFEFACWDLPTSARAASSTAVMAVALPDADADRVINPCEAGGLYVCAIDTHAWAMVRATAGLRSPDTITAVADLGWENPSVVLIADGVPIYQRSLADASLSMLHRAVMSECSLGAEETEYVLSPEGPLSNDVANDMPQLGRIRRLVARQAQGLAAEIEASLTYASHRYPKSPVQSVLVTGGGARINGIVTTVGQQLGVPTKAVAVGDLVDVGGWNGDVTSTSFATAIGLALHEGAGS